MPKSKYYITIVLLFIAYSANSQEIVTRNFRAMFYNVENLFDPFDDSTKNDNEFTPNGTRHWTWEKMNQKINGIYKTITAVGGWEPPVFVGFCEIENGLVLNKLVHDTPLSKFEYSIIHHESNDPRGIDVALLYRKELFTPFEQSFFKVKTEDNNVIRTREILYTCGLLAGVDTLHIFINHWPSKFGGELETESSRFAAASTLREKIDSIKIFYKDARILIMGDFNDEPESLAIAEKLGACSSISSSCLSGLINISAILKDKGEGSYKYQGNWGMIDQIIVSESFLDKKHNLWTDPDKASVFSADFLLEDDEAYFGKKPFRTFNGYKYHGGYSDHLPVYIDLMISEKK